MHYPTFPTRFPYRFYVIYKYGHLVTGFPLSKQRNLTEHVYRDTAGRNHLRKLPPTIANNCDP